MAPPPAAPQYAGQWSVECTKALGGEGTEYLFEGLAPLLPRDEFYSVASTVDALNAGAAPLTDGYCVVFSNSKQLYFLLYRSDMERFALERLGFNPDEQTQGLPSWSEDFAVPIGAEGTCEHLF